MNNEKDDFFAIRLGCSIPRKLLITSTPQATTAVVYKDLVDMTRETHAAIKNSLQAPPRYIDSVCGVVWGVEGPVEGESPAQMLWRFDMGFANRIDEELKNTRFGSMVNRQDFLDDLNRQKLNYLNNHPVRKELLEMAMREFSLNTPIQAIEMSRDQFVQQYLGSWPCELKKACKCGVEWDAILYGAKCGKCGEKRPVSPVAVIKVTDA